MTTAKGAKGPEAVPVAVELELLLRDLANPDAAPKPVPTGLAALDWLLQGGLTPGEVMFVVAHSSVGKTWFALQMAVTRAERGDPVLVVSQEMSLRALTRRLVVQQTQVPTRALKSYDVTPEQARRIVGLMNRWRGLPLFLTDQARSVGQIEALVEAWPAVHGQPLGLLVVDYLQITQAPREVSGHERVEYVTEALKHLGARTGATVLILSATTPGANASVDDPAGLYSARGSRALINQADVVAVLNRKKGAETAVLEIEKARDGEPGTVRLEFRRDILRFEEAL